MERADRGRRRRQRRFEKEEGKETAVCGSSLQNYKAIVLVLLAAVCMTFNSVLVKYLRHMTAAELAFVRNIGIFVLNLPFFMSKSRSQVLNRTTIPTLVARGVFGFANLYFLYLSLKLMPISDASVISSTTPIWVVIISRIMLKEKLDLLNSLSIVLSMVGLLLMSRVFSLFSSPSEKYSDPNYWLGCLCSLLNALLLAIAYVLLRKLKGVEESVTIFFHSLIGSLGMAFSVMISRNVNLPLCGMEGLYVVLLGVSSYLGQTLITTAFRLEKAGAVSSVRTSSQVVLSFLFQLAFFNDKIDLYSILAAVCVFVALWLSGMRKYYQAKRREKEKKEEAMKSIVGCSTESKV